VIYKHNSCEKTRLNHSLFHFTNLRGRERKEITNLKKRKEEEAKVLGTRGEIED